MKTAADQRADQRSAREIEADAQALPAFCSDCERWCEVMSVGRSLRSEGLGPGEQLDPSAMRAPARVRLGTASLIQRAVQFRQDYQEIRTAQEICADACPALKMRLTEEELLVRRRTEQFNGRTATAT